jgi:hypothetical protein
MLEAGNGFVAGFRIPGGLMKRSFVYMTLIEAGDQTGKQRLIEYISRGLFSLSRNYDTPQY